MKQPARSRLTAFRAVGLVLLVMSAVALAWAGLRALRLARAQHALTVAMVDAGAAPVRPLLPAGYGLGGEQAAGEGAMLAAIRAAAGERHLLLERAAPLPVDRNKPAELAVAVTVSGPEPDVLHFAHRLEAGRPAIRFRPWRLGRTGPSETAVRLEARALAYRSWR